jgi:carbonic anhydrase/acetyltransferase-like protein (isoleucine patch superfamily)
MNKKYELVEDDFILYEGKKLYRIRALKSFATIKNLVIKKGQLGGYIEGYRNLSQEGKCWVFYDDSKVYGNAVVKDLAVVMDDSEVRDNAIVKGCSEISNRSEIFGNAVIRDSAKVHYHSKVYGNAVVRNSAIIEGRAEVSGNVVVSNVSEVVNSAMVSGNAEIFGAAIVKDSAMIVWRNNIKIHRGSVVVGPTDLFNDPKICSNAILNDNEVVVVV